MNHSADMQRANETLDFLRRRQLGLNITAAIVRMATLLLALWLGASLIEAPLHFQSGVRIWLAALATGIPLVVLFLDYYRLHRDPSLEKGTQSQEWWALQLGQSAPDRLRDRLLNALQVCRATPTSRDDFSADLAHQALLLAVTDVDDSIVARTPDPSSRKRSLRLLSAVGAVTVLCGAVLPSSLGNASWRLLHPNSNYTAPLPFALKIEAPEWAYRAEAITFHIAASGQVPSEVTFGYRYSGGEMQETRVALRSGTGNLTLPGLSENAYYSAWKGAVSTSEQRLEIVARPQITDLRYRLTPPRYTGQAEITGPENSGDVEGLPGSLVRLNLRATKTLGRAYALFYSPAGDTIARDTLAFNLSGREGSLQFTLRHESDYEVRLQDDEGHPDRDPVHHHIRLTADQSPAAVLVSPERDVDLGDVMVLQIAAQGMDDFGVASMQLAYRIAEQDSNAKTIALPTQPSAGKSVQAQYQWDLGAMALMPGDVVDFWVIAWDNDNVSGPKKGESEHRLVRLPTVEEIASGVNDAEQEGFQQAQRVLDAAKNLKEEAEKIGLEMKRNPESDWQRQREMDEALKQQENIQKQTDALSQKINDLVEKLQKHDLSSLETIQKYQELQQLLAQISTPELKEAMDKLKKALESQDPDQMRQAMEQFDFNREQFLQNIERTMNILKQLQLERRLDELVNRTNDLLHQQEDILDRMKGEHASEQSQIEKKLANQTEDLLKQMDALADSAQNAGEKELGERLDSISSDAKDNKLTPEMQEAARSLSQNRISDAQIQGEKSARQLSQMAGALDMTSQEFKKQRKNELANKVRRLAEELLYLSDNQEDIAKTGAQIGSESPRYRELSGDQQDVRSGLDGVINRLFDLSKESFFITPDLSAQLGAAAQDIDKALGAFAERSPRAVAAPQKRALGEINGATRQLLGLLSQIESSSSSSGFEEMMQKLSQMASAQQGLNEQTMPMFGQQEGQMSQSMSEQMAQMAAQQRALQQQMEKAAQEAQGMSDILGDLQSIADSMGGVAQDIDQQRLTDRTKRLQQQIVNRLLDATRSARQEEYSRERESRSAIQMARPSPPPLPTALQKSQMRQDLLRALQEGYTRDYRELIRQYFEEMEKQQQEK